MIKRKNILFIPIFVTLFFITGCQLSYYTTTESGVISEITETTYTVSYDSVRVFDVTRIMENFRYDKKSHREKLMENLESPEAQRSAQVKPNYKKTYKLKKAIHENPTLGKRVKNFLLDTKLQWTL